MSELNVNQSKNANGVSELKTDDFLRLKNHYQKTVSDLKKSDFANSPAAFTKELDELDNLLIFAKKLNNENEINWINKRRQELILLLAQFNADNNVTQAPFYLPVFKNSEPLNFADLFKPGTTVEEMKPVVELLSALTDNQSGIYSPADISKIVFACKNNSDGKFNNDSIQAVKTLASANFSAPAIETYIKTANGQSGWNFNPNQKFDNIADNTQDLIDFTAMGFDENSALLLTEFLDFQNKNFADKSLIKSVMHKFFSLNIPADKIIDIVDALAVLKTSDDSSHPILFLDKTAADSIVNIKKAFLATRSNELNDKSSDEWRNDIIASFTDKDNKEFFITSSHGIKSDEKLDDSDTVFELMEQYKTAISEIEDNFLIDFAKSFKNEDGYIDLKYPRTVIALRRAGITYNYLFDSLKFCFDSNSDINKDSVNAINILHKNGIQSSAIPLLLDELTPKNSVDISFDKNNINTVCRLASSGKTTEELISILKASKNNKGIICPPLINIANHYSAYNTDFICNILSKFKSFDGAVNEIDADRMIKEINRFYNQDEGQVSFVFSSLLQKNFSVSDILLILDQCRQDNGIVHEGLSDAAVSLFSHNIPYDSVVYALNSCRLPDGQIDDDSVQKLNNFLSDNPDLSEKDLMSLF